MRLLRLHWGFSQEEMAEELDSTRAAISSYEDGRTKNVPATIVNNLSKRIRIPATELVSKKLDANKYAPKESLMMVQEASENYHSRIRQEMSKDDCMKALEFAERTIQVQERLLTEKERVIQLLSK